MLGWRCAALVQYWLSTQRDTRSNNNNNNDEGRAPCAVPCAPYYYDSTVATGYKYCYNSTLDTGYKLVSCTRALEMRPAFWMLRTMHLPCVVC